MEQIYILNENGSILGTMDRKEVHKQGILHLSVQCWVMNEKGEILIQKRSAKKRNNPGKWDVSFGGHCTVLSTEQNIVISNLIKEGKEELGLEISPDEIIKLGEIRYTSRENKNRELIALFLIKISSTQKFIFEDGEVSETKWINPAELQSNILHNPDEYTNRLGAISLLKFYQS